MNDSKTTTPDEPIRLVPVARPVSAEAAPLGYATPPNVSNGGRRTALIDLVTFFIGGGLLLGLVMTAGQVIHSLGWIGPPFEHALAIQIIWSLLLCVLIGVLAGRRRGGLAAIGWRADQLSINVGLGVLVWLGLVAFCMAVSFLVLLFWPDGFRSLVGNRENVSKIFGPVTLPEILGMCAAVGVYEEVVFRGFLLQRLRQLTGSVVAGIVLSTALFGALHLYEGWVATGVISGLGLILSIVVLWRKSLVPAIVAHFLFNTGMMLMMRFGPAVDPEVLETLPQ